MTNVRPFDIPHPRPVLHEIHVPRRRGRARTWLLRLLVLGALGGAAALVSAGKSEPPAAGWDGWRSARRGDGAVPLHQAIAAGQEEGILLHPCRGVINGDMHVGRVRPDFGGCHVGFDGREVEVAQYDILAPTWKASGEGPYSPFVAGLERVAGPGAAFEATGLHACRAAYQGGVHSGQARAGERGCSFGFGGKQIVATSYEVLQPAPWMVWTTATARNIPDTAIVGGTEAGEPILVCRAQDRDGLHPGKIKRSASGCSIVSEGREVIVERFEILVTKWSVGRSGTVPIAAYASGRESGRNQFVCRAQNRDTVQVGKVNEALGGCHVGMQGREVVFAEYEVLAQ